MQTFCLEIVFDNHKKIPICKNRKGIYGITFPQERPYKSHDKRLKRVYWENRVLQIYFLFAARTNAISMSSFVSCSVSGASHSWELKRGVRFDSLRAWFMMSVYFEFFIVGLIIGSKAFQLSWKCGRSHDQRSNPQSIPYFFAMSATSRHFFGSDGYSSGHVNAMSTASQSWWFEWETCESFAAINSFCLSSLRHVSVMKITSDFLFTSQINFSTFSLNFGESLSVPRYAVVFILLNFRK